MPQPPFCRRNFLHQGSGIVWLRMAHAANPLEDVLEPHCNMKPIEDALHWPPG
ncbi:hypothetical protein ACVBEF_08055 [Glaciimonas sp. GG7]